MIEILREIVQQTPGAVGAVLMGFDGIAVEHVTDPERAGQFDVESIAMEFSLRFIELRAAAESLDLGVVSDITINADNGVVLVRVLSPEYFVAVVMAEPNHFGKGRWILRRHCTALAAEIA